MKTATRKLALNKTTLRHLAPDALGKIAGGPDTTADCSARRCSDPCGGGSGFCTHSCSGYLACWCLPPAL